MPRMDGTGPLGKGPQDGRKLGRCSQEDETSNQVQLGKGLGLRRRAKNSSNKSGRGRRLQSGDIK